MERILQVIGGLNRAGAETMLMNLYRQVDKKVIQFDFLIYKQEKQDYEEEIISAGGRILRIPESHSFWSPFHYICGIRRVMMQYGPYKAIHAHTLHNGAWALLAALSFPKTIRVMHSHSTSSFKRSIVGKLYNSFTKLLIQRFAQKWVACSVDSGIYLYGRQFIHRGIVIHNGINLEQFLTNSNERSEIGEHLPSETKTVKIVCVGRLMPVKNHVFAIQIAAELKRRDINFQLTIAGDGELHSLLLQQIDEEGLNEKVHLIGNCPDVSFILKESDVFLMPSLFEGLPVSLIEAQAAGLPCIVSDKISSEADMGLGLWFPVSLKAEVKKWTDRILEIKEKKNMDYSQIRSKIREQGYDALQNINKLLSLYGGNI